VIGVQDLLKEFDSVEYVSGIGTTPARVHRPTRSLQINKPVWDKLPVEHQVFVLCHELGHAELNSSDEMAVDKYASAMYTRLGYSLSESVRALTDLLNNDNPDHRERAQAQLDRAREYDYKVNGNKKVYDPDYVHPRNPRRREASGMKYDNCTGDEDCGCGCKRGTRLFGSLQADRFGEAKNRRFYESLEYNNVDGDTTPVNPQTPVVSTTSQDTTQSAIQPMFRCLPGEKAHHCKVRMRAESKAYLRESRGLKQQDIGQQHIQKGNAEELLAAQGIAKPSGAAQAAQVIESVGDAAGNVIGAWKGTRPAPGAGSPDGIKIKDGNMTIYLGLGAAALAGFVLLMLFRR